MEFARFINHLAEQEEQKISAQEEESTRVPSYHKPMKPDLA